MTVSHTTENSIAHVQLNRPEKLNAIDEETFVSLLAAAQSVRDNPDIAAIVLSGAGASFSAGLDFSMHASFASEAESGIRPYVNPEDPASEGKRVPGRGQAIVSAFRDAPAPVIAALQGHVIGAGLQIALGADIRLVRADAKMGFAEINFGMTVDMGATQLLPKLVGTDRALDLILSGRMISGEQAVLWGLATRQSDDPLAEAFELAVAIAGRSSSAVQANKRLIRMSESAPIAEGMREELRTMSTNIGSAEQVAATKDYFERRAKP